MSISSTGLYGSTTIVNTDLFDDVQALKEEMVTLSTSYLTTTNEHRTDISQNRQDISSNLSKINDLSNNRIKILWLVREQPRAGPSQGGKPRQACSAKG